MQTTSCVASEHSSLVHFRLPCATGGNTSVNFIHRMEEFDSWDRRNFKGKRIKSKQPSSTANLSMFEARKQTYCWVQVSVRNSSTGNLLSWNANKKLECKWGLIGIFWVKCQPFAKWWRPEATGSISVYFESSHLTTEYTSCSVFFSKKIETHTCTQCSMLRHRLYYRSPLARWE